MFLFSFGIVDLDKFSISLLGHPVKRKTSEKAVEYYHEFFVRMDGIRR